MLAKFELRPRTKGLRPLGDKQLHSKLKQESKRGTISTNIICFYDTVRESCYVWEFEETCKKDLSIMNRPEASAEQTAVQTDSNEFEVLVLIPNVEVAVSHPP